MSDKDRYFPREHSALKARNRSILRLYRQTLKDGTPRYTLKEIGKMTEGLAALVRRLGIETSGTTAGFHPWFAK